MHPAAASLLRYFDYDHLPAHLQLAAAPFHDLAVIVASRTSGPETTTGLRKLLEAKDCIVRAELHERPDDGIDQAHQTQPEGD